MILSGNPIDYLIAFFAGVMASFTPCIYPLIPISAGYIGAQATNTKSKNFLLALVYVTGIAITYSILGLVASLTGSIFGSISTHPASYIIAGIIIVFFGLSMLGFFNLSLPNIIKLPAVKERKYISVFILGLVSGLIISPCLTPVLGAILAYLATKQNLWYGVTLLFSFAYGMGAVLILAATFTSAVLKLPKAGKWMVYVQRAFAVIFLFMGSYFIYTGIRRI